MTRDKARIIKKRIRTRVGQVGQWNHNFLFSSKIYGIEIKFVYSFPGMLHYQMNPDMKSYNDW